MPEQLDVNGNPYPDFVKWEWSPDDPWPQSIVDATNRAWDERDRALWDVLMEAERDGVPGVRAGPDGMLVVSGLAGSLRDALAGADLTGPAVAKEAVHPGQAMPHPFPWPRTHKPTRAVTFLEALALTESLSACPVEKFNQNHDPKDGRFTDAPGSDIGESVYAGIVDHDRKQGMAGLQTALKPIHKKESTRTAAIREWYSMGGGYKQLNKDLRRGEKYIRAITGREFGWEGRVVRDNIRDMDALAKGHITTRPLEVFKMRRAVPGWDHQGLPSVVLGNSTTETAWTDLAYVSTSLSKHEAMLFGTNNHKGALTGRHVGTLYRIRVPKGSTVGLGYDQESEIILPRNARFRVVSVKGLRVAYKPVDAGGAQQGYGKYTIHEVVMDYLGPKKSAKKATTKKRVRKEADLHTSRFEWIDGDLVPDSPSVSSPATRVAQFFKAWDESKHPRERDGKGGNRKATSAGRS